MANETTIDGAGGGGTIDDFSYAAWIVPALTATLAEHALPMEWCRELDIVDKPSNAAKIPNFASDFGAADDDGAGVDAEYNGTQATALGNTSLDSGSASITSSEYGISIELTDQTTEDLADGFDLFALAEGVMARALALAWTDDFCALTTGLSNSVGATGVDATIAVFLSAQTGIRTRGGLAPDGLKYVLDNETVNHMESALTATSTSAASYATATDRILGAGAGPNNGMDANRHVLTFRGYQCIATGLTDLINTAADTSSMCFTPDGPGNRQYATFANVIKRLPRLEPERDAKMRSTSLVMTMRMAPGEVLDGTGTEIVADAP